MKIKVVKGSEVFDKLTALIERCQECNKAVKVVADELGAKRILTHSFYRAGGVTGFMLAEKPEGWKNTGLYGYYFPKSIKANRVLLDRIAALPSVNNKEFNEVIGYQNQTVTTAEGNWMMARSYGLFGGVGLGVHLIELSDGAKFDLLPGMEEIKTSEYLAIMAQLEAEKEVASA